MDIESLKFNIAQASYLLGVSQGTLRRWEKEGKIKPPARTSKKAWRFYSLKDIERIKREVMN